MQHYLPKSEREGPEKFLSQKKASWQGWNISVLWEKEDSNQSQKLVTSFIRVPDCPPPYIFWNVQKMIPVQLKYKTEARKNLQKATVQKYTDEPSDLSDFLKPSLSVHPLISKRPRIKLFNSMHPLQLTLKLHFFELYFFDVLKLQYVVYASATC